VKSFIFTTVGIKIWKKAKYALRKHFWIFSSIGTSYRLMGLEIIIPASLFRDCSIMLVFVSLQRLLQLIADGFTGYDFEGTIKSWK
jgi:hypothetical protein